MISSDQAMQELIEGNCRFAGSYGESLHNSAVQTAVCTAPPLAIVLCCSDLDVAPETLFDQPHGSLFTVRTKANMVRDGAVEAMRDVLARHGVRLVVVLGHRDCLAVQASVQAGWATGELGFAIERARLSVRDVSSQAVLKATRANIRASVAHLRMIRASLAEITPGNGLLVAGSIYNPHSKRVDFIV